MTETSDGFDGNTCTLRNAIESVNLQADFGACVADGVYSMGAAGGDHIVLIDATYTLSDKGQDDDNTAGDLDIINKSNASNLSVNIMGVQGGATTIDAADLNSIPNPDPDRVLHILGAGSQGANIDIFVTGSDLTLTNGRVPTNFGGAIFNDNADLLLQRTRLVSNFADTGGGLYTFGPTVVEDHSIIDGNTATVVGGGVYNGIALVSDLTSISNNQAKDGSGGGIFNFGFLSLSNCTLDSNEAFGFQGAGIFSLANAAIFNSTISRNTLHFEAGNESQGELLQFKEGGGIYSDAPLFMVNTTVSGNTAPRFGGGLSINGPFSGTGGPFPGVELRNVTIANNSVTDLQGQGGGLCVNCSFRSKSAVNGSGPSVQLVIYNTLIAENTAEIGPDCTGDAIVSGGFNLIGDDTDCNGFSAGDTDQLNVPAGIGPLQKNGGPTETHGLQMGSLAIDMGNDVVGCQTREFTDIESVPGAVIPLTEDGRGFVRPIAILDPNNPICDIGAFEFQTFNFEVTKNDDLNGQPAIPGSTFSYIITVTNNGPGDAADVTLMDPIPNFIIPQSVNTTQGECSIATQTVSCDLGDIPQGISVTINIVVVPTQSGDFTNIVTVSTTLNAFQNAVEKTAQVTTQVTTFSGSGCSLSSKSQGATPLPWIGFLLVVLSVGLLRWT